MEWRFIPFRHHDPYRKMALNDMAISRVQGTGKPIIWLSGWRPGCVSIGAKQRVSEHINVPHAESEDVPIVRRQEEGGAMYLTEEQAVTWCVTVPDSLSPEQEMQESMCARIQDAVEALGIDTTYTANRTLATPHGKLAGFAARTAPDVVQLSGTVLYDIDPGEALALLTPDSKDVTGALISWFSSRVTTVSEESDASFEETVDTLRDGLLADREYTEEEWMEQELTAAETLEEKYRSEAWIFKHD